jgi:hypothetical protein
MESLIALVSDTITCCLQIAAAGDVSVTDHCPYTLASARRRLGDPSRRQEPSKVNCQNEDGRRQDARPGNSSSHCLQR